MLTLSLDQTRAFLAADDSPPFGDPEPGVVEPLAVARDVVHRFREHAGGQRSFSVDAAEDRYIPPQEYLAAVQLLAARGEHA